MNYVLLIVKYFIIFFIIITVSNFLFKYIHVHIENYNF